MGQLSLDQERHSTFTYLGFGLCHITASKCQIIQKYGRLWPCRTTLIKSKNSKTKSKEFLISDACPATKFTVAVSPPLMDLLPQLRRLVAKNGQKMDPLF